MCVWWCWGGGGGGGDGINTTEQAKRRTFKGVQSMESQQHQK